MSAVKAPTKQYKKRQKRKHKRSILHSPIFLLFLLLILCVFAAVFYRFADPPPSPDWADVQIIDVNGKARRGVPLKKVKDIVIHYVGNSGSTAQQNRDYFAQEDTAVSAHFLIGLEGEVIQCIPLDEKSSATNKRNGDTISIEVCHLGEDGAFTEASYASLVKLTAWLCDNFHLSRDRVIRHYDVTGKLCPLYFVEHEDAWAQFLADVKAY